ncbi:MAG: glycosyltransferase [Scytolyngbya sp. HA4215-MV1]|jgi:glycosyltransferase involved in cell wall biosynthesis|nr:glycosyltransferase [Scytolyngbya sp. HA4215-MV1]
MTSGNPKVSIGLPVFNGERYLREAIDSILTQTFTDFELIISDNASTDSTEDICKEYLAQDPRVRYYRNSINIGCLNNCNRTFELSNGKYFRFAAHDDICASELIEKCVEILDRDPSIVLCYSNVMKIDEDGREIGLIDKDFGISTKPHMRFRELGNWEHNCETVYGLIRTAILKKTDLLLNYSDADRTFLCELSLHGKFFRIPENLFYKRYHPEMSTRLYPDPVERMTWYNLQGQNKVRDAFHLKLLLLSHYLKIIGSSSLSLKEKINCYIHIKQWLLPGVIPECKGRIKRTVLYLIKKPFVFVHTRIIANLK